MDALKDDSVNVIGVYGMGGVGKTTLVKQVAKKAREDNLFGTIIMTVVSQNQDVRKIQGDLAEMLKLDLREENVLVRAGRLFDELKGKKNVLIILDDIWERLDLEAIGIPHSSLDKGCSVLLTSRDSHVCVAMNAQKRFLIKDLSEQDAWLLFKKMAGDVVESPDLHDTAVQVAKGCAGLPLAVVTVASALKQNRNKHVWTDALGRFNKDIQKKVFSRLQWSYEMLEREEHRSLFLLCCLFPEDYNIPIELLVRYGMGLRLFEDVREVEACTNRAIRLVDDLKNRCLLLDGKGWLDGTEGWLDGTEAWLYRTRLARFVRMHDIIRDVAISIASSEGKFLVKTGSALKEWSEDNTLAHRTAISLIGNCMVELPHSIDCPNLQIFALRGENHNASPLNVPATFFDGARNLKVLHISQHFIPSIPSIRYLKKLRTLCLEYCKLQDVSQIGELEALEILSFVGSNIKNLPCEIGHLTQLRLLDLTNCKSLKVIPAGVLASFSRMECLHMIDFNRWEAGVQDVDRHNAGLVELKSMSDSLNDLQIQVENVRLYPKDLIFKNLKKFRIFIGHYDDFQQVEDYRSCELYHRSLVVTSESDEMISLEGPATMLCATAQYLNLEDVKDLEDILDDLRREGFSNLKNLSVHRCDRIEYLFSTMDEEIQRRVIFPMLEVLELDQNRDLRGICWGHIPSGSFCNLKRLAVGSGEKMKYIFGKNAADVLGEEDIIQLPKLEELDLWHLPNLRSFCPTMNIEATHELLFNRTVEFPVLRSLNLNGMSNIKEIWQSQLLPALSFCTLKELIIDGCHQLRILIPSNLAQRLQYCKYLHIGNCKMLEEVFEELNEGPNRSSNTLPQIDSVELRRLPKLKQVWWNRVHQASLSLQNLRSLDVEGCHRLRYLFTFSVSKLLSQLRYLALSKCSSMEEVILTERGEDDASTIGAVVFPKLDELKIENMQELTSFCRRNCTYEFPSLKRLRIEECPKWKTFTYSMGDKELAEEKDQQDNLGAVTQSFFNHKVMMPILDTLSIVNLKSLDNLWHNELSAKYFSHLRNLRVEKCDKLLKVMPINFISRLKNLEEFYIDSCNLVESIVEQGEEESTENVVFRKLHFLSIANMPMLTSFYQGKSALELPSMRELRIRQCPKMRAFVYSISSASGQGEGEENDEKCKGETSEQPFFSDKVILPSRIKENFNVEMVVSTENTEEAVLTESSEDSN